MIRLGALVASGVVVAGGLVLEAGAASAATLGTLTISPAAGTVDQPWQLNTSGACAPSDTRAFGTIVGPAGFSQQVLLGRTSVGVSSTDPMTFPAADSLLGIAQGNSQTINPGRYDLTVSCAVGGGPSTGDFVGHIYVTGTGTVASNTYQTANPNAVASTTALTATPPSPSDSNTPIGLTATVTSPSPGTNTGTVQFKDGVNNLGSPVTVSGGVATLPATTYAAASHSFSAIYSGDQETAGSTGTLAYTVTPAAGRHHHLRGGTCSSSGIAAGHLHRHHDTGRRVGSGDPDRRWQRHWDRVRHWRHRNCERNVLNGGSAHSGG